MTRPQTRPCLCCDTPIPLPPTGPFLTPDTAYCSTECHHIVHTMNQALGTHPASVQTTTRPTHRNPEPPHPLDQERADHLHLTIPQLRLLKTIKTHPITKPTARVRRSLDALTQHGYAKLEPDAKYVLTDHGRRRLAEPLPETPDHMRRTDTTKQVNSAVYYGDTDGRSKPDTQEDIDEIHRHNPTWVRTARTRHEHARPTRRRRAA